MIAAERKYRHRELVVGRERFVVGSILREGRELIECAVHRAGACIEPRIVAARCLFDRFGIGGKFVPKPVEINALAALDQPLHVRPTEVEVPQQRAAGDFVPGTNSRQRRVNHDPERNARGKLRRKRIADHIADIVRNERSFFDL
jgi:hypothetical protein